MNQKDKICKNEGCGKIFKPFKTTDKYCSLPCALANKKESKKTQYKIPKKSKKLKEKDKIYRQLRKIYLSKTENQICPVTNKQTNQNPSYAHTTSVEHIIDEANEAIGSYRVEIDADTFPQMSIHIYM